MKISIKHGIYAHPFEMVACVSTALSVYAAFQLLLYHPEVLDAADVGILSLPKYILWIWVIMGFLGSVLTASGLTLSIFSTKGRVLEEQGLWLMGAMWLSAGISRSILDWDAWIEYVRYMAIAVGCVLRLMMINDFHHIMQRSWREANKT